MQIRAPAQRPQTLEVQAHRPSQTHTQRGHPVGVSGGVGPAQLERGSQQAVKLLALTVQAALDQQTRHQRSLQFGHGQKALLGLGGQAVGLKGVQSQQARGNTLQAALESHRKRLPVLGRGVGEGDEWRTGAGQRLEHGLGHFKAGRGAEGDAGREFVAVQSKLSILFLSAAFRGR